mgnify:CR=1 FL=1
MKAVILAGGRGSRLSEITRSIPKPLVSINGKPILFHIIDHLRSYGIKEFIICIGYLGHLIKDYFLNYKYHNSDIKIDFATNDVGFLKEANLDYSVSCIDTGKKNETASRIKLVEKYLTETFLLTYGDGVSDVNINKLINSHKKSKKLSTITAVPTPGRWGNINIKKNKIMDFTEKPTQTTDYINGGFFIVEPEVLKFIKKNDKNLKWEKDVLETLVKKKQLNPFIHRGLWRAVDTINDKEALENILKK